LCIWRKTIFQKKSNYNEILEYNWIWKTWIQINKNQGWKKIHYKTRKTFPNVVYRDNYAKLLWVFTLLFVIFIRSVLYSSVLANMRGSMKSLGNEFGNFLKSHNNLEDQPKLFEPQYTLLNLVWKYRQINCKKLHLTNTVFWCLIYLSYMSGYTWQLADFLSKALSFNKFMKFQATENMAIIHILLFQHLLA
jgi:hypothetical protein